MKMIMILAAISAAVLLTGCEPDKISIEVPVSAIQKAQQGETTYLKIRANGVAEFAPDSILKKKDLITRIIEKYLGKGSHVTMRKDSNSDISFSAQWRVPLFIHDRVPSDSDSYPLWLVVMKDNYLRLVSNKRHIDAMNEELNSVDFMLEAITELGMTDIVFNNDTSKDFQYRVYGAFINGAAKILWTQKVAAGEESTASYGRKSSDSIWHDAAPLVELFGEATK